jgi:hypothetical protein
MGRLTSTLPTTGWRDMSAGNVAHGFQLVMPENTQVFGAGIAFASSEVSTLKFDVLHCWHKAGSQVLRSPILA